MRLTVLISIALALLEGCTLARIEHDGSEAAGAARLTNGYSIDRSSRWRLADSEPLEFSAARDPEDPGEVELIGAAYAGVARVFPQAVLVAADAADTGTAVRMVVELPRDGARSDRFPVTLLDARAGGLIDRAVLTLHSGWGSSPGPSGVSQLFADYALQLRPKP